MRQFIRHPADIPIEVRIHQYLTYSEDNAVNVGIGGLAFCSKQKFAVGDIVDLRLPFVRPIFEAGARVAWCRSKGKSYELGVEFLDKEDAFLARMVEQICQIEHYQKEIYRAEGRLLSPEEAANEWISKFASQFPGSNGEW